MKRLLLLSLSLLAAIVTSATRITEQEALQRAQQFLQGKAISTPQQALSLKRAIRHNSFQNLYIFNVENGGGFVIVAGDDNMPEILGYSEKGSLTPGKIPANVMGLLSYYEKVGAVADKLPASNRQASNVAIPRLLSTQWDQGAPYNQYCPMVEGGVAAMTGCVATAMAQVINYHRWPQGLTNSVAEYYTTTSHIMMPSLPPVEFQWDNMTNEQIARLMLYCGQAVQMDYQAQESGANPYLMVPALCDIFGYSRVVRLTGRAGHSDEEWENLLYNELANQRPVIYSGFGQTGGHTFVVEGYKEGQFYVNWGWGGNWDGYFQLTNLTPYDGASFNNDQSAIIGIQPTASLDDATRPKAVVQYLSPNKKTLNRESSSEPFEVVTITSNIASDLSTDASFHLGLALYDDSGLKTILAENQFDITALSGISYEADITLGSDIAAGEYRIVAVSRLNETDEWLSDAGSSGYYIALTIDEKTAKLKAYPSNGEDQWLEDYGFHTIDGITYELFSEYGNDRARVQPSEAGSYPSDLYIPDVVSYDGKEFEVAYYDYELFMNNDALTSLSIRGREGAQIFNCPNLAKLEIREGLMTYIHPIQACPALERIDYPTTLNNILNAPSYCQNLKTINFKTQSQVFFQLVPDWSETSMPALTDIYFLSDYPPVIKEYNTEFHVNPNVTIHIPQGTRSVYEKSAWAGWKLSDDQPAIVNSGIKWGYCKDDNVANLGLTCGRGENDCELAMHVPAEMLAPYKGQQISTIEFYTWPPAINDWHYEDVDYVFITKPGTDYLVKQPVSCIRGTWQTITLDEPYTITGDELYVGMGHHGTFGIWFSDDQATAPDGVWCRAMGTDTSYDMVPGLWENMAVQSPDWNHPMPLRFTITGDALPANLVVDNMQLIGGDEPQQSRMTTASASQEPVSMPANGIGTFTTHRDGNGVRLTKASQQKQQGRTTVRKANGPMKLQATVTSRTPRTVNSYTLGWNIDGQAGGNVTINTELLPNHSETVTIQLPATIQGRSHELTVDVENIDGEPDAVPEDNNTSITIVQPASTRYPRKLVMEEATGTWCGWCVRGIESIQRLAKEYPDNFIAIGVHSGDNMDQIDNYEPLLQQIASFPSCAVNRTGIYDPAYWTVRNLIEEQKDQADAKIEATASFATRDQTAVAIETQTTFGFSDPSASYRIAYVVVEDSVGPYVQQNFYSNPTAPHDANDYMDEWVHREAAVKLLFNDVARGIYDSYEGIEGTIPTAVTEGETYQRRQTITLPKTIQKAKNIRIVVLLIDSKTGEILNADQTAVAVDEQLFNQTFHFSYHGKDLPDGGTVTIEAEEDAFGFGELNCETNPPSAPREGLVVKTKNASQTGTARLEILSNTLAPKSIQWCMGGECVLMNNKTTLDKTFTTDAEGIVLVQFDATNIGSEGKLEARLTISVGNETQTLNIVLSNENEALEPTEIYYREQQLYSGKRYTSSDLSDIKAGSFKISKDKKTITLNNLVIDCQTSEGDGDLFKMLTPTTVELKGENSIKTQGYVVMNPVNCPLTITGSGQLTTQSTWYDFFVNGQTDFTIDNTTLICQGPTAIGNNMYVEQDNIVVKNATFKGKQLFRLASLTLINSAFKSEREIIFDPEEDYYGNLKYADDGGIVYQFEIEPVEGDFAHIVTPTDFGKVYVETGKSREVNVKISHKGTEQVNSIAYTLTIGGQQGAETTYALPEPSTKIGSTFELPLTITGTAQPGVQQAVLTVTKVNGVDNGTDKNTAMGTIYTVNPTEQHSVVVEEYTGTWCGWCTRGIVALDLINKTFGDKAITIAIHKSDPMYAEDLSNLWADSYPSCTVNRGPFLDPYYGSTQGTNFAIERDIEQALQQPVVGTISATAAWTDEKKTAVDIIAETTFLVDSDTSPYQIGFIMLEDGMRGTGSEWAQNNVYSGWNTGDPNLDVITNQDALITDMEYNHVAVAAWGADKGLGKSVSTPIRQNETQTYAYRADISQKKLIQDKERLSIVALLLDREKGTIINAAKCAVSGLSAIRSLSSQEDRPADVYDMSGRKVRTGATSLDGLPHGIYIVNGQKVMK